MKALFIICSILGKLFAPVHDVPIATFHISESNASIDIAITFDLEDLSISLETKTTEVNLEKVQDYLTNHTTFQFNTQIANLKISALEIVKDHVRVKGNLGKIRTKIETIKIENSCLNNVPRHSNVILVDLNDESKDYRMHKGRTVINLEY